MFKHKWKALLSLPSTDECLAYSGHIMKNGYGQVWYEGRIWTAHRLSYFLNVGMVDDSLDVCHSCDNRPCINPKHLFQGTRKDNMEDCRNKGRNFIPRGELGSRVILTEKQVLAIRVLYPNISSRELAAKYGVSTRTILSVARGDTWKHI